MTSLSLADLRRTATATSLESLGFAGLADACRRGSAEWAPDPGVRRDPRTGLAILDSPARARRLGTPAAGCPVCEQRVQPAVDILDLPGGDQAWLTPNTFPLVHPFEAPGPASGLHLVHWSSRHHDGGWPGADGPTAAALLDQLARTEAFLLHHAPDHLPATGGDGHRGHVGVIKNRGRRVGGSVEHDHQQILLSAQAFTEPPRSVGLADQLLDLAGGDLVVDDLGDALTVVPPFMNRPLQAFVVPRAPPAGWLHHLARPVRDALALAVARLSHAVTALMTERHGEPAWNLITHTGAGCAPLLELRPFTQPLGGYEHLGLYLCEERPNDSAAALRAALPG